MRILRSHVSLSSVLHSLRLSPRQRFSVRALPRCLARTSRPPPRPPSPHARRRSRHRRLAASGCTLPFDGVLWRFPLISRTLPRFGPPPPLPAAPLRASPGPPARPLRLTPRGSWCEEGRGVIREARGEGEGSLGTQTAEGSDRGERASVCAKFKSKATAYRP